MTVLNNGNITTSYSKLTLDDFDFDFPEELVAHTPLANREESRLLVKAKDGQLTHRKVTDLLSELPPGTVLLFNNSRVFPSRLEGALPSGGRIELFLLREIAAGVWSALGRPLRKLAVGKKIIFPAGVEATILNRHQDFVEVSFNVPPTELSKWLDKFGYIPLPPYIKRQVKEPAISSPDRDRYQTIYAHERGSVAAPTAGLHFTGDLLKSLTESGVEIRYLSLHVGAGTFLPVKSQDINKHEMHHELYHIPAATLQAILMAKAEGRKVVAVGTTTFRSLEDVFRRAEGDTSRLPALADTWHSTDIFIYPQTIGDTYRPWMIDGIVTNFHQPKSTLFMLISTLVGVQQTRALYAAAIQAKYRLFSYGDTSLLWL